MPLSCLVTQNSLVKFVIFIPLRSPVAYKTSDVIQCHSLKYVYIYIYIYIFFFLSLSLCSGTRQVQTVHSCNHAELLVESFRNSTIAMEQMVRFLVGLYVS